MPRSAAELHSDALAIWHAGLNAVRSDRLVTQNVHIEGDWLLVGDRSVADELRVPLASTGRIAVVGAGKAGAGMAAGLLEALGPQVIAEKCVAGWLNVPADCAPLSSGEGGSRSESGEGLLDSRNTVHLHPARPAGINEPTAEGVFGAEKILGIVGSLDPSDLCFCLLSGGGSALLPAPVSGVSLEEKQFGAESPYLVRDLTAEAQALRKLGRNDEAAKLEQRTQALHSAQTNPN